MDYTTYLWYKHRMLVVLEELYPAREAYVKHQRGTLVNCEYFIVHVEGTAFATSFSFRVYVYNGRDVMEDFLDQLRSRRGRSRNSTRK